MICLKFHGWWLREKVRLHGWLYRLRLNSMGDVYHFWSFKSNAVCGPLLLNSMGGPCYFSVITKHSNDEKQ